MTMKRRNLLTAVVIILALATAAPALADTGYSNVFTVDLRTGSPPTPSFTWSPASPTVGQPIQFTDTSTGSPTSWSWDFGDGSSSHGQNPTHTYSSAGTYTVRMAVANEYGTGTPATHNIQVIDSQPGSLTLGGITFKADSIVRQGADYKLTGTVSIGGAIHYSGTLSLKDKDNTGKYHMEGQGALMLPSVEVPGWGPVVLYDGTFDLGFKNGGVYDFLEDKTKLKVAGWVVKIQELDFIQGGIQVTGALSIPQFGPGLKNLYVAAGISATANGGVRLTSGDVQLEHLGLAGGFSLDKVKIHYDRTKNEFDGQGTLKTPTFGLKVGVVVLDGCPNGATITVTGVPVVLGNTGLQIVNYGVDATGLCGFTPFGIGLHTDITLAGNPDPDLLSLANLHVMYFPLTTLNGGGTVRVLKTDMGNAQFFFNDGENDCLAGLCVRGRLGLPSLDEPFFVGELDSDVLVSPFQMSGSGRMAFQIPKSCWDLGLPRYVSPWLCPILSTSCGSSYPCVLAETSISFSAQPGGDPEASVVGNLTVLRHSFWATLAYSESHDKEFHIHFGKGSDSSQVIRALSLTTGASEATQVIAEGTKDAYLAVQGTGGVMPLFKVVDPDGVTFSPPGTDAVEYYKDQAHLAAVYALKNPKPGVWKLVVDNAQTMNGTAGPTFVSHVVDQPAEVRVDEISGSGDAYDIRWVGKDPEGTATVDLAYVSSVDGPVVGMIAQNIPATGALQSTTWDVSGVPPGRYFVRALIHDPTGTHSFTYGDPIVVEPSGSSVPSPPANLVASKRDPGVVDLTWDASPSGSVAGYLIVVHSGILDDITEFPVGAVMTYHVEGLDPSMGHEIWVVAYDNYGLRSETSNVVSVAWQSCQLSCSVQAPETAGIGQEVPYLGQFDAPGCFGTLKTHWDFGDGEGSNNRNVSHTYVSTGTFPWSFRASVGGSSCSQAGSITVDAAGCAVVVEEPTEDDALVVAEQGLIRWRTIGTCSGTYAVDLYRGGEKVLRIANNVADTQLAWTPPSSLDAGDDYHVRVNLSLNASVGSFSHAFQILAAPTPPLVDPGPNIYLIPASAHAPGLGRTSWVSDVVLYNQGFSTANVYLYYLQGNHDHTGATGKRITVPAGASVRLGDVVGDTFGSSSTSGALYIGSDQELLITSRTYNNASSGTYGQFIAGMPLGDAIGANQTVRLIQLTRSGDYRTNIGFANASGKTITVKVKLYRSNGSAIATRSYTVQPYGFYQKADPIGTDVSDAYALISSSTSGAKFFTYASVIDNRTGDPVYITPGVGTASAGQSLYIPGSAHVNGLGGTHWRTDVEIHNPGTTTATYRIELLKRGQGNTSPQSRTYNLSPGHSVRYTDALSTLFGFTGAAALRITPSSGTVTVSSRTYNEASKGTYGQFVPAVGTDQAVTDGHDGYLLQLAETNEYRTNIGFVNATGSGVHMDVAMYDGSGSQLGNRRYFLDPYKYEQRAQIFTEVTSRTVSNGYAIITTVESGARVYAYASVVDNRSGDPVYVPAAIEGGGGVTPGGEVVLSHLDNAVLVDQLPGAAGTSALPSGELTATVSGSGNLGRSDLPVYVVCLYKDSSGNLHAASLGIGDSISGIGGGYPFRCFIPDWVNASDNTGSVDVRLTGSSTRTFHLDARSDAVLIDELPEAVGVSQPESSYTVTSTGDLGRSQLVPYTLAIYKRASDATLNVRTLKAGDTLADIRSSSKLHLVVLDWVDKGDNTGETRFTPGGGGGTCTITVTSPNGGESWELGSTHTVRWNKSGTACNANIKAELLKGSQVVSTIRTTTPNDGALSWVIPASLSAASNYRGRLTDLGNTGASDTSNGYFSLTGAGTCTVTVTSPNGGESWELGSTHTVRWNRNGTACSANIKAELLKGSQVVSTIRTSTPNDGALSWVIPASLSAASNYRVRLTDLGNTGASDTSNGYFSLTGGGGGNTLTVTLPGGVKMELVHVTAGSFTMGSPPSERGRSSEEVQHQVTLTHGYYIGKYEVTQAQWEAVMGHNPAHFTACGGNCPVENVSWDEICGGTTGSDCKAQSFIGRLNAYLGTGKFRLPTEAEWEHAARAGTQTPFFFGDDTSCPMDNCSSCSTYGGYMWWCGNANNTTHAVGSKNLNAWGLGDVHGNVWELVADWWGTYPTHSVTDPKGPSSGTTRVIRGGSWLYEPRYCRSAYRYSTSPYYAHYNIGFRLARSE